MGVIDDFSIDDFWDAEDAYNKMIERFKERAKEIAIELGVIDKNWSVKDIELVCNDDEGEISLIAYLVKNKTAIEKARNCTENNVEVKFPMDWLFYEDYQDDLQQNKNLLDEQTEKEYAEYLRLKEKFEPKC